MIALVRVDEQRPHGFAMTRVRATSRSERNQCRRSAYGTAAFAGDVDGST